MKRHLNIIDEIPDYFKKEHPDIVKILNDYYEYFEKILKETKNGSFVIKKTEIEYFKNTITKIIKLFKTAYTDSIKDYKTELYNMKFFDEMLNFEFQESIRKKNDFCVIIIDIDFFKKINDTYGHLIGDEIIEEIGKILKKSIRKIDIAARFGGEEFIILYKSNIQNIKKITDRIMNNIIKNKIMKKYNIHISGGVSYFKNKDKNPMLIKNRADKLLYQAKKNGRNQFIIDK